MESTSTASCREQCKLSPLSFPLVQATCTIVVLLGIGVFHALFSRATKGGPSTVYVLPLFLLTGFLAWNGLFLVVHGTIEPQDMLIGWSMFGFVAVGYTELFLNLYRGFSYSLIADIGRAGWISDEAILSNFAEGLGDKGMMERRFASMEETRLIQRKNGVVILLARGAFFAHISLTLRRCLRLEKGGGEIPSTI